MFEEHSVFEPPPPETEIWRYMDYPNFVWTVQTDQLHFHKAAEFDDPHEGAIPNAAFDYLYDGNTDSDGARRFRRWSNYSREVTFLNCWHANTGESAAMWKLYGQTDKAIAIKSTVENLERALAEATDYPIGIGSVRYVDFDSNWVDLDDESKASLAEMIHPWRRQTLLDLFHLKRPSFEHEREVRLYVQFIEYLAGDPHSMADYASDFELPVEPVQPGDADDAPGAVPDGVGFDVDVDVETMIDAVLVSPTASPWVVDSLERLVERTAGLELDPDLVERSRLLTDPWNDDGDS